VEAGVRRPFNRQFEDGAELLDGLDSGEAAFTEVGVPALNEVPCKALALLLGRAIDDLVELSKNRRQLLILMRGGGDGVGNLPVDLFHLGLVLALGDGIVHVDSRNSFTPLAQGADAAEVAEISESAVVVSGGPNSLITSALESPPSESLQASATITNTTTECNATVRTINGVPRAMQCRV
jgi:hypothetical protein